MTKPTKCAPWQHEIECDVSEKFQFCIICDQRFVPSDVLEEARAAIRKTALHETTWHGGGGRSCTLCGASDYAGPLIHKATCLASRLDALLGGT